MGLYYSQLEKKKAQLDQPLVRTATNDPVMKSPGIQKQPVETEEGGSLKGWLKNMAYKTTVGTWGGVEQFGKGVEALGQQAQRQEYFDPFRMTRQEGDPEAGRFKTTKLQKAFGKASETVGSVLQEGAGELRKMVEGNQAAWVDDFYKQPIVDENGKMRWGHVLRPDVATGEVANMVGQMFPALAAAYITGGVAPISLYMGGVELGQAYEDYSQGFAEQEGISAEQLTPSQKEEAFTQAFMYATISAYLETIPFEGISKVGVRPAMTSVKQAIKEVGGDVLRQALAEGGTEAMQQFVQNVIAKQGGSDPNRDLMEGVKESAYAGAATGVFFGLFPSITAERATPEQMEIAKNIDEVKTQYREDVKAERAKSNALDGSGEKVAEIQRTLAVDDAKMFNDLASEGTEIVKNGVLDKQLIEGRIKDVTQKLSSEFGKEGKVIGEAVKASIESQNFTTFDEFTTAVENALRTSLPQTEATIFDAKLKEGVGEPIKVYRGEGSEGQAFARGANMESKFGEGLYVSPDEGVAKTFAGDKGKVTEMYIKPDAKTLVFTDEGQLDTYVREALKKYPKSETAGEAMVKLAKDQGYQVIDGTGMQDRLAGMNVIDESVLKKSDYKVEPLIQSYIDKAPVGEEFTLAEAKKDIQSAEDARTQTNLIDFNEKLSEISDRGNKKLVKVDVPINEVEYDQLTKSDYDKSRVKFFEERIKAGQPMAPAVVRVEDGKYKVLDGRHRIESAKNLGSDTVTVVMAADQAPKVSVEGKTTENKALVEKGKQIQQVEGKIAKAEGTAQVANVQNVVPRESLKYVFKEAQKAEVDGTLAKAIRQPLSEETIASLDERQRAIVNTALVSIAASEESVSPALAQNVEALGGTMPEGSNVRTVETEQPAPGQTSLLEVGKTEIPKKTVKNVEDYTERLNKMDNDIANAEAGRQESLLAKRETMRERIADTLQKDAKTFVNVKAGKGKASAFTLSVKKLPDGKYGYSMTLNTPGASRVVNYLPKFNTEEKALKMGIQGGVRILESARRAGVSQAGLVRIKDALMQANQNLGGKGLTTKKIKKVAKEVKVRRAPKKTKASTSGNVMGSVGEYSDTKSYRKTISSFPHVEMPELLKLAKELNNNKVYVKALRSYRGAFYPLSSKIVINPGVFKNPEEATKVLAHELGHLVDFLPQGTMKRGGILGRILSLKSFLKQSFGDENGTIKAKEIRNELWNLSNIWRPIPDNATESFLKYRKQSTELYADAISVLFNDPDLLYEVAPKFYKAFFQYLDRKPRVKQAFFDTWELINKGEEALLSERQKTIYEMFKKGEDVFQIKRNEKKENSYNFMLKLKTELVDRNQIMIDKVRKAQKEGKIVSDDVNPVYFLEEYNYLSGVVKNFVETKVQPILNNLQENGISWEDFGAALMLERAINERGEMANPGGFDPKTAEKQLDYIKKGLGQEKADILMEQIKNFRDSTQKIIGKAGRAGLYKPELMEQMKANKSYATFQVIDYLEDYIPASIKRQVGTFSDIANPATSTIMKMISVIRATEVNNTKRSIIDFLTTNEPENVKKADTRYNGRFHEPIKSKEPGEALFTMLSGGEVVGYYVDPYIADIFENNSMATNKFFLLPALRFVNTKISRPLLIQYNPGFMAFNFIRDFWRFWKNIPDITFVEAYKQYKSAVKPSIKRAWGEFDPLISEMEGKKILGATYNEMVSGQEDTDKQIEYIIKKSGITQGTPVKRSKMLETTMKILEFLDNIGQTIETLPKVAGYTYMKDTNIFSEREAASFIRTSVGSPDFFRKGAGYAWTNEVFLFSNAIKEAIRADVNIMKNPKTRTGYWTKTASTTFAPKLIMIAAAVGLLGEPLKELFKNISEYDKTNYICVPFGIDKNGKTMYLRIPQDETSRFLGGLLWKGVTASNNETGAMTDLAQLFSYTGGQLPSISPVLDTAVATGQFLAGKNPYDFFRGRSIVPDREFEAGGMEAFKPFALWAMQNMGANVLLNFDVVEKSPTSQSFGEKLLQLPVVSNVVGRFIKISDYGQIEKARAINSRVNKENSQRLIKWEKAVNTAVKEYKSGKSSVARRTQIENELVTNLLGSNPDKRQANYIRSKFNKTVLQGFSDTKTRAVLAASTNNAKIEVLKTYKKDMSLKEFRAFLQELSNGGVISDTVYNEFN